MKNPWQAACQISESISVTKEHSSESQIVMQIVIFDSQVGKKIYSSLCYKIRRHKIMKTLKTHYDIQGAQERFLVERNEIYRPDRSIIEDVDVVHLRSKLSNSHL